MGPLDVLVLSAWCGLAAGLLEVAARVSCRTLGATNRLYQMSHHFVWLTPLSNLLLFLVLGLFLAGTTKLWPRRGGFASPRLIATLAILPPLLVCGPQIYSEAWLIVAMGIASRLVPILERHFPSSRRWLVGSFSVLLGSVLVLATVGFAGDRLEQWRESARPRPPAASPNVLLIVLDTVRADHLSLYGYYRPTSPTLERLASRGIRFDGARATAPWTLPSHASMLTGRWPRELDVQWLTPLRTNFPTLAQYLGSRGYATAGFVANALYCSYDTRLNRGFTHYEDYALEKLGPLRTAGLVDGILKTLYELSQRHAPDFSRTTRGFLYRWFFAGERKDASSINRAFVDWLSRRQDPGRPFFVFLNYLDAHTPYRLPDGAAYRFGSAPKTRDDYRVVFDQWISLDKMIIPPYYRTLARDCYDNCLAYLDDRLGALFQELQQKGVLDRTLVIITSDHGEGLGEHGLFDHGESLYGTEIRVPLLILLPSHNRPCGVVKETVSLRDLPATVVDLLGLRSGSPFPGRSLARLWQNSAPNADPAERDAVISELMGPSPLNPNHGRSPAHRGPLISLAEGDLVYIRNEGDGTEELFNERNDPNELSNQSQFEALQSALQRFRQRLDQWKADTSGGTR
jgi:arylsulfatase A-like enzyme